MVKKKSSVIMTLLLAFILCLGGSTALAAPTDFAPVLVVDYLYLIDHHPDAPKANAALKSEQEQVKKEFETKSAGLNDKDKQDLDRQLRIRLEQKRQELLKPISDSINEAIKAVAQEKGGSAVLHKNTMAWGGTDITEDVLKKLNKQ